MLTRRVGPADLALQRDCPGVILGSGVSVELASDSLPDRAAEFATTHWSVVLAAGKLCSPNADAALGKLCRNYWYPLYAFTRRQGYSPHDAQDLTQGFFAQLLGKNYLGRADPKRGRFRSFLLASLKHYLANEWDRQHAAKRGGAERQVVFTEDEAEYRYLHECSGQASPETLYDREWALTILDAALARLHDEFAAANKAALFDHLKQWLSGENPALKYTDLGLQLGLSEGAVKVTIHRMRKRFRELIRLEISQTLGDADQLDDEMRHLLSVLSS